MDSRVENAKLYTGKEDGYFKREQSWIADLIPMTGARVLDVGCGEGTTGVLLKRRGIASEVHGIELVQAAAARATDQLDSVITGNIEHMDIPFPEGSFDVIVMTEVLEHLVDPWRVVRVLKTYLRDGGILIASTPNIRYMGVLWSLAVRGRWEYQEAGILDRTHLRFFTKSSIAELFSQADLHVDVMQPIMSQRLTVANRWLLGLPEEFFAKRYGCRAQKRA